MDLPVTANGVGKRNFGKVLIDEDDRHYLTDYPWTIKSNGYIYALQHLGYANGKRIRRHIYLHRFLLNAKEGQIVDHKNGNKLDNRRSNLRFVTAAQNTQNRGSEKFRGRHSNYKGVCRTSNTAKHQWRATITRDGIINHLGTFEKEIDAARAYNRAAAKFFGDYARLNKVGK